jgi:hypothetical protein
MVRYMVTHHTPFLRPTSTTFASYQSPSLIAIKMSPPSSHSNIDHQAAIKTTADELVAYSNLVHEFNKVMGDHHKKLTLKYGGIPPKRKSLQAFEAHWLPCERTLEEYVAAWVDDRFTVYVVGDIPRQLRDAHQAHSAELRSLLEQTTGLKSTLRLTKKEWKQQQEIDVAIKETMDHLERLWNDITTSAPS